MLSFLRKMFKRIFKGWVPESDTACVVVGMRRSSTYGECAGSNEDACAMAGILSGYGDTKVLADDKATVSSVVSSLKAALSRPLCIFYYSGHGGQEDDRRGDGGVSEFLCLDDGPLHDYDIWKLVSRAAGRVVMVFDCCHSATMYRSAPTRAPSFSNTGFSFRMLSGMRPGGVNLLVWAGCPSDDLSYGGESGGVFTNGIRIGYGRDRTYDQVWRFAEAAARRQRPERTVLGSGFDGKVFT